MINILKRICNHITVNHHTLMYRYHALTYMAKQITPRRGWVIKMRSIVTMLNPVRKCGAILYQDAEHRHHA